MSLNELSLFLRVSEIGLEDLFITSCSSNFFCKTDLEQWLVLKFYVESVAQRKTNRAFKAV